MEQNIIELTDANFLESSPDDSTLVRQAIQDLDFLEEHTESLPSMFTYSTKDRRREGINFIKEAIQTARKTESDEALFLTYRIVSKMATGIFKTNDAYRGCLQKTLDKIKNNRIMIRRTRQNNRNMQNINSSFTIPVARLDESQKDKKISRLARRNENFALEIDRLQEIEYTLNDRLKAANNNLKDITYNFSKSQIAIRIMLNYLEKNNISLPEDLNVFVSYAAQLTSPEKVIPSNQSTSTPLLPNTVKINTDLSKNQTVIHHNSVTVNQIGCLEIKTEVNTKHSNIFKQNDKMKWEKSSPPQQVKHYTSNKFKSNLFSKNQASEKRKQNSTSHKIKEISNHTLTDPSHNGHK